MAVYDLVVALNTVTATLTGIPEPISSSILQVLHSILQIVQQTKDNKTQLHVLFLRICDILNSLKVPQNFADETLQKSAQLLIVDLENIRDFAVSMKSKNFFKAMLHSDDVKLKIEELERRIWSSCLAFQNSALITANKKLDDLWELALDGKKNRIADQSLNAARAQDQNEQLSRIQAALDSLSKPSPDHRPLDALLETLDVNPVVTMTAMTALLERHDTGVIELRKEEIQFLRAGIARLKEQSAAASATKIKSWTVTGFEIEKGFLFGWDLTSTVRSARWLGKLVGLVEVTDEQTVLRLVKTWKGLRSNRIQDFLGASTVDQPPFLLVQHFHFNILEHIEKLPPSDYLSVLLDAVRALEYLHSRDPPVVHAGIRSTTINVDDNGNVFLSSIGVVPEDLAISEDEREEMYRSLKRWYSPELQQSSNRSYTPASDVFALGVVFSDVLALLKKNATEFSYRDQLVLEELVQNCTDEDPSARLTVFEISKLLDERCQIVNSTDLMATVPSTESTDMPVGLRTWDRWRVACFVSKLPTAVWDEDCDVHYVSSAPLQGSSDKPLRQISVEVKCHDQGKDRTTALPRDGTWTWIELSLYREGEDGKRYHVNLEKELQGGPRGFMIDDDRYEILRCPFADDTPRIHRLTLDHRHPFVNAARKGDQIVLHPRARFPGWTLYIYSAEMQVVTE